MSQEIQYLYKRNKSGNLVFQETAVIETDGTDKTSIVHLEILPDPPTQQEVLDKLREAFRPKTKTKVGVLPEYYAALQ